MYEHLLVATDGSELAARAVAHGLDLANAVGARVTAVTVTDIIYHRALQPDTDAIHGRAL
jgi:nucleotide-binding universal stress UspA family protein